MKNFHFCRNWEEIGEEINDLGFERERSESGKQRVGVLGIKHWAWT